MIMITIKNKYILVEFTIVNGTLIFIPYSRIS